MAATHCLVTAVEERYGAEDELDDLVQIVLPKMCDSNGMAIPRQLVFHGCDIELAGSGEELRKLCGHVTEMDLAQNKLREWNEVIKMLRNLPNVHFVNLSNNFLSVSSSSPPGAVLTFPKVTHLVLNSLKLSWGTVLQLLHTFPCVTELHLSLNDYGTVDLPADQTFQSVECLHFNGNKVSDWSTMCLLGRVFPRLIQLVLAENPLESLSGVEDLASCFPQLTSLFLGRTKIAAWSELERLKELQSLTELRVPEIPLLAAGSYDTKLARQLAVAYLPGIEKLNGSSVTSQEREDAERAFIRHYMDQSAPPARYMDLVKIYGKLDPLVEIDLEPTKFVDCIIKCGERSKLWKVNTELTVGQFKRTLEGFVGAQCNKWKLFCYDPTYCQGADELKYFKRKLFTLNLAEGTEFIVDMK